MSGQETRTVERFGPFLARAWETRREMPADEQNGVVPLDSKFGIAWRDWRVLSELAGRTGRADFAEAAATISTILGDRAADRRIETLQDRIHRLYAWWLLRQDGVCRQDQARDRRLISLQRADGGWYELDSGPGRARSTRPGSSPGRCFASACRATTRRSRRRWRYLLAQQQDFGGWFQTTTHENFRTPMRETRYAVMALAEAFPRPGGPVARLGKPRLRPGAAAAHRLAGEHAGRSRESLGRARGGPCSISRGDRRAARRSRAARARGGRGRAGPVGAGRVGRALAGGSPTPPRSSGAPPPGRCGGSETTGKGVDVIKQALDDADPRVRRGATRIFAYQFYGMDERQDLAERLIELCSDPDLWTRLQSLKTLRQWFYRTKDQALSPAGSSTPTWPGWPCRRPPSCART